MSVWEDLTVCDFIDIIDSWKLVGLGKMGFKAQTCWTDLLAFWGVWNRSRILNFGPDRLFFRFSRALVGSRCLLNNFKMATMVVIFDIWMQLFKQFQMSIWTVCHPPSTSSPFPCPPPSEYPHTNTTTRKSMFQTLVNLSLTGAGISSMDVFWQIGCGVGEDLLVIQSIYNIGHNDLF